MRSVSSAATVVVLALGFALVGCGPVAGEAVAVESPSAESPAAPASESPAAPSPTTATPPGVSAEVVFPECEQLIPIEVLKANFSPDAILYPDGGGWTIGQRLPGPVAKAAVEAAPRKAECGWGVEGGSDGGVHAAVIELPTDVRDGLIGALRDAGSYTEATVDGATVFTTPVPSEISSVEAGYAFLGATWIAIVGSAHEGTMESVYLPAAVSALRTANGG